MVEEIKQRQRGAKENGCGQTTERHLQMERKIEEGGGEGEESRGGGGARQCYKSQCGAAEEPERRREKHRENLC